MKIQRIRHKLLIALVLALSLGFAAIAYVYTKAVENSIMRDYRVTLQRLADTVVMNIETVMKEDHAEIMADFALRLKKLPGVIDFRIARTDGTEAFVDNQTIDAVNARLKEKVFAARTEVAEPPKMFTTHNPAIQQLFAEMAPQLVKRESSTDRGAVFDFYDIVPNSPMCDRCHGATVGVRNVRGVVRLTTSMIQAQRDIAKARVQSLMVLVASLVATVAAAGYMLGRYVAQPIEEITLAMARVSEGQLGYQMEALRRDELGQMARIFNQMTTELNSAYLDMTKEKDKLSSVIQGAQEAVVVTDALGKVVLVNDSAEGLLGKSVETIKLGGLLNLLDQPERFQAMLNDLDPSKDPTLFEYKGRWLLTSATTIHDDAGAPIGSAALLRDVTLEQSLLRELEHVSITDALTDVFNRRHLDATLQQEMRRSRETGVPLAVIMIDVDHFKKFNDTYGHDQGDRVLKMAGQVMKATARPYDIPCRYGGEEFTVILPNTTSEGAMQFAERLRHSVQAMTVDGLNVTISLGVACVPEINTDSPEALIEAADAAMYKSKEKGRNCATLATAQMLAPDTAQGAT